MSLGYKARSDRGGGTREWRVGKERRKASNSPRKGGANDDTDACTVYGRVDDSRMREADRRGRRHHRVEQAQMMSRHLHQSNPEEHKLKHQAKMLEHPHQQKQPTKPINLIIREMTVTSFRRDEIYHL